MTSDGPTLPDACAADLVLRPPSAPDVDRITAVGGSRGDQLVEVDGVAIGCVGASIDAADLIGVVAAGPRPKPTGQRVDAHGRAAPGELR
jgi:hypothetical protein